MAFGLKQPTSSGRRRTSNAPCLSPTEPIHTGVASNNSFPMLLNLLPHQKSPSSEDSILPLSASSKTSFDDAEVTPPKRWFNIHLPSLSTEILLVILLFPATTGLVLASLWTLPITVSWPKNLSDMAQLGAELQTYGTSGFWPTMHVVYVLSISAIWKHAWSIPGSVVWNVLAGALWSPLYATVLLTVLTSLGSVAASLLAKPLAPLLTTLMPRALDLTRQALQGGDSMQSATVVNVQAHVPELPASKDAPLSRREKFRLRLKRRSASSYSGAWVRLSVLRLVGIVPWSGINIASGVCGVPLFDCLLGSFIGTLPWTAVTCQIGDILQTVASSPNGLSKSDTIASLLTSREVIVKLALLSFLSLSPILCRNYLKSLMGSASPASPLVDNEKKAKWPTLRLAATSVSSKIRHSRNPTQELHELVQEKRALGSRPNSPLCR